MKPTKEEIEKFADYCEFLFTVRPFMNKEDDLYIYDKLSSYGWTHFEFNKTKRGYFTIDLNKVFGGELILITDLMPGYKKFLLLK